MGTEVAVRLSEREFIVSAEELFTLRQGLFIATNYLDSAFRHDWHAITGCDCSEFVELMRQIDDLGW
jgi:hypothetical protein